MSKADYPKIGTPSTRYRGSKRKIIDWLLTNVEDLKFDSVLDAFGGTGVVSYMFKSIGKKVTYNDYLEFNHYIGKSVIENDYVTISENEIDELISINGINRPNTIKDIFSEIYYLEEENEWLDNIINNINNLWCLDESYKKELAFNALFQSCLIKRPFNLFHRKNLNIRTANVNRTFGNKVTWDSTFEFQFKKFAREINSHVFSNGLKCESLNKDVFKLESVDYDLVYIDPPYLSLNNNEESANYLTMYHFLEGICNYNIWQDNIDWKSNNKKFNKQTNVNYFTKDNIEKSFTDIIDKFKESIIVFSYKSDGFPSVKFIEDTLRKHKKIVDIKSINYKYALKKNRLDSSKEILFIAK